jgi:hypothetical protein
VTAPTEPTPPVEKTFTQAEVEAPRPARFPTGSGRARRRRSRPSRTRSAVSLDEAKTILQQSKDAETARLSEARTAREGRCDREAAAQARETAAVKRERDALVRAELIAAGAGAGIQDENERRDIIADAAKLVTSVTTRTKPRSVRRSARSRAVTPACSARAGIRRCRTLPRSRNPTTPTPGPKSLMEIAKREFPEFVNAS